MALHGCRQKDSVASRCVTIGNYGVALMNMPSPTRSNRKPLVTFDGKVFHVTWRGRSLDVLVAAGDEEEVLVELDGVTHWAKADGDSQPQEIAIDDLGVILEAIENAAEDNGLSISFE